MDVKAAARMTEDFVRYLTAESTCQAVSAEHLRDMLTKIQSGEISGEKAHRWLGWVQGVLCARGAGSLEEFKAVNHQA